MLEATGRGTDAPSVVVPSSQALAKAAADLTRDAASLLTAA